MIERLNNWESLLSEAIEMRRDLPFTWGAHDCCVAACGVVMTYWPHDPMAAFRGDMYANEVGAGMALRKYGKGTLIKTLINIFAHPVARQIAPALARRGDVVLTLEGEPGILRGQAVGICIGARAVFADDVGWYMLPMQSIHRAWAIGW